MWRDIFAIENTKIPYFGIFVFSAKQNLIDSTFRPVRPCTKVEAVFETAF